jgi:hypothetical protein
MAELQASDLTDTTTTEGAPSFAFLAKGGNHRGIEQQRVQLTTIYGFKTTFPNI